MKISLKVRSGSVLSSLRGLMFESRIEPIYFETRFGIHTFFVKKPIDVVILDKNFVVRKMYKGLAPLRIFFWNPRYNRVIEGPSGMIRSSGIKVDEKLNLEIF